MEIHYTVDDVARISDDTAVRHRFDQRNYLWLLVLHIFFAFSAFLLLVDNAAPGPLNFGIALADLVLLGAGILALRDVGRVSKGEGGRLWRVRRWMFEHMSAVALAFAAIQYLFMLVLTRQGDGWYAWIATFPLMMIGFRMLVSELILLHVYLFGTAAFSLIAFASERPVLALMGGAAGVNAVTLAIELLMSRRLAAQVRKEWGARRAQAREQVRMRDELLYARELQLNMLPECDPKLSWADICSTSLPATEVGGDYYDYFVEDDRIALVSGDVAGHGVASGIVLASIRGGFLLLRHELHNPAYVLERLDELVAHNGRHRMLVTAAVVLIDRIAGEAVIASAGHPPVIIRRANGDIESIELHALPLGVRLPVSIAQRRVPFGSGDLIVLHSDGIYEARNPAGDSYGLERLEQVIRDEGHSTAQDVRNAIIGDVSAFRAGRDQDDDATVVVFKML